VICRSLDKPPPRRLSRRVHHLISCLPPQLLALVVCLLVAHLGVAADKPEKSAATTNAVTGKWIYTLEVLMGNCFLTLRGSGRIPFAPSLLAVTLRLHGSLASIVYVTFSSLHGFCRKSPARWEKRLEILKESVFDTGYRNGRRVRWPRRRCTGTPCPRLRSHGSGRRW